MYMKKICPWKFLALCQIVLFKQNLYKKKDFGSSFFVIL